MKLRQKLAAVLAATMVVTAVPAMAASTNSLTHGIVVDQKGETITGAGLKIEMKDNVDTTGSMFFVNLENAEWAITGTQTTKVGDLSIEYKTNSKKELQVTIKADGNATAKENFTLPLNAKLTGGEATVSIDGNGSVISDMAPVVFAKTSDAKANVTVGEVKNIYKDGVIADIIIEEGLVGSMDPANGDNGSVKVSLDNTDYEFVNLSSSNIELSKGFSNLNASFDKTTGDEVTLTLDGKSTQAPGRITLKNVRIKLKSSKTPVIGDQIAVTVEGEKVTTTTVKVAEVKGFGNTISMKDDKVVEAVAGTQKAITFSIKENVDDSILENREIEVKLDKGYLSKTNAASQSLTVSAELNGTSETINVTPITNKDGYITGFSFKAPASLSSTKVDEITFKDLKVFVPLNEEGDITLTTTGRALAEEASTVALSVKAPVEVESEALTLKVGLKDQKGGKITIKETDKAMLKANQLIVELPAEQGMTFSKTKPVIKVVEGDLQIGDYEVDGNQVIINVKRASKTASTIEISDFVVSTDRTLPQGSYDVAVKGSALVKTADTILDEEVTVGKVNEEENSFKVEDFIVIGTANTEDLGSNGLKKGTAVFKIGEKSYTMNGVKQEMDAAAYISNGRTMIPVRYIANALGINNTDIFFANNTVTIIAGNKTISMEIGSKIVKLNGVAVRTMETAPVITGDRTYVPVSEIGAILGVEATWDGEAKTATFENK
ncbi:hypothetical protein CS063_11745 [Sporanaerobium hydrogeniformans]|uniref:Uncharacterized protein n=1 Tax=Sporanaerobium hydrogeniformans TaxID=3072179 RepID=A0AC61DAT2_9FIRM|nr:copper amine oxidase N-terminal domain-containing protein [Sporanaerobium hydrogeniformans]PHV70143.1 hypothetical protein CS063_11745 [Sporanaerobium hydrogeniformans]